MQGVRETKEVEHEKLNMITRNRCTSVVSMIWTYKLVFYEFVRVDLDICCYLLEITRNIIYFHALF